MPLPKSHPHARKQSVIDPSLASETSSEFPSSLSLPSNLASYASSASSSSSVPPSPATSVSALSNYSIGLDPITETPSITPPTSTRALADPLSVPPSTSRRGSLHASTSPAPISLAGARLHSPAPVKPGNPFDPSIAGHSRSRGGGSLSHLTASIGLGQPPTSNVPKHARSHSTQVKLPPTKPQQPPRTAFSSSFAPPNTEVLLWSYAQLIGIVELDESSGIVALGTLSQLRGKLNSLRTDGVVGGGRMDIGAPLSPSPVSGGGTRSRRSFISSLWGGSRSGPPQGSSSSGPAATAFGFGMNALSSLLGSPSLSPVVTSFANNGNNYSSPMTGLSGGLPASALPTFETQPSLLAVDLNLGPGESRSCESVCTSLVLGEVDSGVEGPSCRYIQRAAPSRPPANVQRQGYEVLVPPCARIVAR